MLTIWLENIAFQPFLSRQIMLNYISKYASNSEKKYESYIDILQRLAYINSFGDKLLLAYQKFMMKLVVDHHIGA